MLALLRGARSARLYHCKDVCKEMRTHATRRAASDDMHLAAHQSCSLGPSALMRSAHLSRHRKDFAEHSERKADLRSKPEQDGNLAQSSFCNALGRSLSAVGAPKKQPTAERVNPSGTTRIVRDPTQRTEQKERPSQGAACGIGSWTGMRRSTASPSPSRPISSLPSLSLLPSSHH